MGNLRDIRRRIKSVKNTSQITRAMQMVASAKMRRAQDQAVKGRPYIRALAEVLGRVVPPESITVSRMKLTPATAP